LYKILGTKIDDGKLLIKVKDLAANQTFLYYVEEIEGMHHSNLKTFLQKRLHFIEGGAYG